MSEIYVTNYKFAVESGYNPGSRFKKNLSTNRRRN